MNPTDRIPCGIPPSTTAFERMKIMLGHFDLRIYVSSTAYIDVGAGSLGVLTRLAELPASYNGCLGTIGRFCEFHDTAKVVTLGEHDNDRIVNITFGALAFVQNRLEGTLKPYQPFTIGNAVVASTNAIILGGRSIGDGVVIGAGAVVSRDLESHAIYAGVPAKKLRDRPQGAAWWDFAVTYLKDNLDRLEDLAEDQAGNHQYRPAQPRIMVKMHDGVEILGQVEGERRVGFSAMPSSAQEYIKQAMTLPNPYWIADCWA